MILVSTTLLAIVSPSSINFWHHTKDKENLFWPQGGALVYSISYVVVSRVVSICLNSVQNGLGKVSVTQTQNSCFSIAKNLVGHVDSDQVSV